MVKQTKDKKLIKFLKSIEFFSNKNLDETLNFFLKSKYYSDLSNNNYLNLKKKSYYKNFISKKTLDSILVNSNKYFPKLFNNVKNGKNKRSDLTISEPSYNKKISRILNLEFKKNGTMQNLKNFWI